MKDKKEYISQCLLKYDVLDLKITLGIGFWYTQIIFSLIWGEGWDNRFYTHKIIFYIMVSRFKYSKYEFCLKYDTEFFINARIIFRF